MKKYEKEKVLIEIKKLLDSYPDNFANLQFAKLLLDKVTGQEDITLSKEEVSTYLFDRKTNKINPKVFLILRNLEADLTDVCFDNIEIMNYSFKGLENVTINLDLVPDKNLSGVGFAGVTLLGSLDDSILYYTDFTGHKGNIILNPQKIKNKSIYGSKLSDVTVEGNFDDVEISYVDFTNVRGQAIINPQQVPAKQLLGINFSDALLTGNYSEKSLTYEAPSFKDCIIFNCQFKNTRGSITINLDDLQKYFGSKLSLCDLTGVKIIGNAISNFGPEHAVTEDGKRLFDTRKDDMFGSYYENTNHEKIYIHLYQSRKWNNATMKWEYLSREDEPNLQIHTTFKEQSQSPKEKILSFIKRKIKTF